MIKPVSVIIPCYNKKEALRKTLGNTVAQLDYENGDELIVSDGKSTDGVEKMLQRDFSGKVQFVQVEERVGYNLNTVRNLGIRSSKNDVIIIFDADCIPQPGCIELLRRKAEPGVYLSGVVLYEIPYEEQLKQAKKNKGMTLGSILVQNYPISEIISRIEAESEVVRGTIGSSICFMK